MKAFDDYVRNHGQAMHRLVLALVERFDDHTQPEIVPLKALYALLPEMPQDQLRNRLRRLELDGWVTKPYRGVYRQGPRMRELWHEETPV